MTFSMNDFRLDGQVALVTGAHGIGFECQCAELGRRCLIAQ